MSSMVPLSLYDLGGAGGEAHKVKRRYESWKKWNACQRDKAATAAAEAAAKRAKVSAAIDRAAAMLTERSAAKDKLKPRYLLKDLTGQRFGRLIVVKLSARRHPKYHKYWWCQCDCGGLVEIAGRSLSYGQTRSCGCLVREVRKRTLRKDQPRDRRSPLMLLSIIARHLKHHGKKAQAARLRRHIKKIDRARRALWQRNYRLTQKRGEHHA